MEKLQRYGYGHETSFWKGHPEYEDIEEYSWGHHRNMSFEEMMVTVTRNLTYEATEISKFLKKKIFTRFGLCVQIKLHDNPMYFDISHISKDSINDISVFITDIATETYYNIDFSSQKGKVEVYFLFNLQ